MTKRIPEPRAELSPGIRVHEARLLATMLRTSRLTCVFAEPGTDKSALLKTGVMPLLQRRRSDRQPAASPAPPGAFAGVERRTRRSGLAAPPAVEAAIYFDTWGEHPMTDLLARVDALAAAVGHPPGGMATARFADTLRGLYRTAGLRIVFLLDRFEELLARAADEDGAAMFTSELVAAIRDPDLPASFLIALDEQARPRLERFRARMPGFDHNSLRLSPIAGPAGVDTAAQGPGTAEPAALAAADPAAAAGSAKAPPPPAAGAPRRVIPRPRPKHLRGPPPRAPVKVDDVYALIEQTLSRTVAQPTTATPGPGPGGNAVRRRLAAEPEARPARPDPAATLPPPGATPAADEVGQAGGLPDLTAGPAGPLSPGDDPAQRALGTFRLAAALGRLRHRRSGGG